MTKTISAFMFPIVLAACGGPHFTDRREAGTAVATALCERAAECAGVDSQREIDDCVGTVVLDLCQRVSCDATPSASDDEILRCIDDFEDWSCAAETIPASCIGTI